MTTHLPEPHEETLGAALNAIDHARPLLPWYARRALRKYEPGRTTLAVEAARRVEDRTRLLVAREIDTLDDPAWAEAIMTVKQLILAKPTGGLVAEWWKRLPAFSGAVPQSPCLKCGATGFGATSRYVRHLVRPAGCQSAAVFGEYLVRGCGSCGFEWRERCADAPEAQSEPQSAENEPGDRTDPEAATEAHSMPEESATGLSSAEPPEDAHSGAEARQEGPAASESPNHAQDATEASQGRLEGNAPQSVGGDDA